MPQSDTARYRANWQDEIDSAALYRSLADSEQTPQLATVYRNLAEAEDKHAAFWEEQAQGSRAGRPAPPSRLAQPHARIAREALRPPVRAPTINRMEQADVTSYDGQPEAQATHMPSDERSHARLLSTITGGMEGSSIAQLEGRHRASSGNALRAAVLGANDGLLSNFSLVMGVAGAQLSSRPSSSRGFAGLLAGAGSMAMGEWISVQSSRELYTRQITVEAAELEEVPDEEEEELSLIYQAKGLPEQQAKALASRLMADKGTALDTLSREELGIDPKELGGSAWEAAITSVLPLRHRRDHTRRAIPLPDRLVRRRNQRGTERARPLRHRRGHHPTHRQKRLVLRHAPGAHRDGRSRPHLWPGQAPRGGYYGLRPGVRYQGSGFSTWATN